MYYIFIKTLRVRSAYNTLTLLLLRSCGAASERNIRKEHSEPIKDWRATSEVTWATSRPSTQSDGQWASDWLTSDTVERSKVKGLGNQPISFVYSHTRWQLIWHCVQPKLQSYWKVEDHSESLYLPTSHCLILSRSTSSKPVTLPVGS